MDSAQKEAVYLKTGLSRSLGGNAVKLLSEYEEP
jgi:hypothetical protein